MNKENQMSDRESKEDIIDLPIAAGNQTLPSGILDQKSIPHSDQRKGEEIKLTNDDDDNDDITRDKNFDFLNHIENKNDKPEMKKRKASVGSQFSKGSGGSKKCVPPTQYHQPLTQSVILNSLQSNMESKLKNLTSVLSSRPGSGNKKRSSAKRTNALNERRDSGNYPPRPGNINIQN